MTTKAQLENFIKQLEADLEKVTKDRNKINNDRIAAEAQLGRVQSDLEISNKDSIDLVKKLSAAKQAITQHLKVEHQINIFDFDIGEDEKSVDVRFLRFLYEVL